MTDADASTPPSPSCPNCGAAAARAGRFCPGCGQDNGRRRLRARDWLVETFESVANLDGNVVRTIRGMTLDPGGTARA